MVMQSCQKFRVCSNETSSDRGSISFSPVASITSYDSVIKKICLLNGYSN
jgi:hypothetical protein